MGRLADRRWGYPLKFWGSAVLRTGTEPSREFSCPRMKQDFQKADPMTRKSKRQAPQHLRKPTRDWWRSVDTDFELEDHHRRLLTLAGEAWDRCCDAREKIAELGMVFLDRFGQPKSRPEIAIERDSRLAFARLIRELALDVEPPPETPRPPRAGGQQH